ncbi:Ty3/Gypsy family RNase HI domain-containing protein, partial [Vibrio vulnificus]|uniref:RNase H-like domain-containing protein n=1 Tax=Vibrio vulnificus TaxID=672 RepID=UPI0019D46457
HIKAFLTNPPVLKPAQLNKPLLLYLSIENTNMGAMLAQEDNDGKEYAIYYLSRKLQDTETRNPLTEKMCLALVWATRKLRHYCLANSTKVISQIDPLKYLHQTPSLIGRLSRWLILLTELDLEYVTKKTVKGRAVADFLTLGPLDENEEVNVEFPDEALV